MKVYSLKTKIFGAVFIGLFTLVLAVAVIPPKPAMADVEDALCGGANFNLGNSQCEGSRNAQGQCVAKQQGTDREIVVDGRYCSTENRINDLVTNIVNILSIVVGIISVIMIIVGGFKYITSGGDTSKVTSSRNTIIYAIVGLIIVALAQVIVKFVLSKV